MCTVRRQGAGGEISFTSSDSGAWATVYNVTMCALCVGNNVKCVKWTLAHFIRCWCVLYHYMQCVVCITV